MKDTYDIFAKFIWQDDIVQTNTEPVPFEELQDVLKLLLNSHCIKGCESVTFKVHKD